MICSKLRKTRRAPGSNAGGGFAVGGRTVTLKKFVAPVAALKETLLAVGARQLLVALAVRHTDTRYRRFAAVSS